MSRTILYYPTIDVPTSGRWIRGALLYWDQIASIVPESYDGRFDPLNRYSNEIRCLYDEGIFRPVNPHLLLRGPLNSYALFLKEFDQVISSARFRATIPPRKERRFTAEIYKDKVAYGTFHKLCELGLAEDKQDGRDDHYVFHFEPTVARLYMALLAEYLALVDEGTTTPGTDQAAAMNLGYRATKGAKVSACLSARFSEILPLPTEDVSLRAVLKFRKKHRAELLALRSEIDDFESKLRASEDMNEVHAITLKMKERIERECLVLGRALRLSKFSVFWGSLQSFIKPNSPALTGVLAAAVGKSMIGAPLPISWIAGGLAVAGTIEVGTNVVKEIKERQGLVQESPFAYLFLAQRKFSAAGMNAK